MKKTVLCFVFRGAELLMVRKLRGQGTGKVNVPGGKVRAGESGANASIRECREETGIVPSAPVLAGRLEFLFPPGSNWNNQCEVYRAESFTGALARSEECEPFWVRIPDIPYPAMWEADRSWIPLLLERKPFDRRYRFDADDRVIEELIRDPSAQA